MTMDYGAGVAPKGSTMMGSYAISAAQATYKQSITALGTSSIKIGVTPMIGQNDVVGEIFRVQDSAQVTAWALSTPWMSTLAMWSINRDIAKTGLPLYASSQITQKDYDFARNFVKFTSGPELTTTVVKPTPTTTAKAVTVPTASRTYAIGTLPNLKPSTLVRLSARNIEESLTSSFESIIPLLNTTSKSSWNKKNICPLRRPHHLPTLRFPLHRLSIRYQSLYIRIHLRRSLGKPHMVRHPPHPHLPTHTRRNPLPNHLPPRPRRRYNPLLLILPLPHR